MMMIRGAQTRRNAIELSTQTADSSPVRISAPLIPIIFVLLPIFAFLIMAGCAGPDSEPMTVGDQGFLFLVGEDQGDLVRPAMIGGDRQDAVALRSGQRFRSPWFLVPPNAEVMLAYGFLKPPRDPRDPVPTDAWDELHADFQASIVRPDGRRARLAGRTASPAPETGWFDSSVDLTSFAGAVARIELSADWVHGDRVRAGREDGVQLESGDEVFPVWAAPLLREVRTGHRDGAYGGQLPTRLLLLISLDTLRADALGCNGAPGKSSPHLDRLAGDGVLYARCLSPSPWTRPAHMSLLTSLYPPLHGLDRQNNLSLSPSFATWAEIFRDAGFWTGAVTGGGYLYPGHGFERGFNRFLADDGDFSEVCARAADWLETWPGFDTFFFLHTYEVHEPYHRHGELVYHGLEASDRRPGVTRIKARDATPETARKLRLLYTDGLFHTDHQLGLLFARMKQAGLYEEAMIIVTSDHGDQFLEHGGFGHSTRLYDELLHVPLLVKYPESMVAAGRVSAPGTVVQETVEILDLLPTAVQVLDLRTPAETQFQGRPLPMTAAEPPAATKRARGDGTAPGSGDTRLIYAETYAQDQERRAVRLGGMKYLVNQTTGLEELYDLEADPAERTSLVDAGGERAGDRVSFPLPAVSREMEKGRALLLLAQSMGQGGFHLAAGLGDPVGRPGAAGEGQGAPRGRSDPIRGRLTSSSRILSLNASGVEELGAGRVEIASSGLQIDFELEPVGSIPLDFSFELEDPEEAVLEITITSTGLPESHHIVFGGSDVDIAETRGSDGSISRITASDPRLLLPWGRMPGSPMSGVPSIQLYRRPLLEPQQPGQAPAERRRMLEALGYLQ